MVDAPGPGRPRGAREGDSRAQLYLNAQGQMNAFGGHSSNWPGSPPVTEMWVLTEFQTYLIEVTESASRVVGYYEWMNWFHFDLNGKPPFYEVKGGAGDATWHSTS